MIGKGQVREVIEKNGIVQVERAVTRTPAVAGLFQRIDHQRGHA